MVGARALVILLACACACTPAWTPPRSATGDASAIHFSTLSAQHEVTVWAHDREGHEVVRKLRGLLIARAPDRLRVRALGPGDITWFDIVSADGKCWTVEAVRTPPEDLLRALCDDLRAAFALGPTPPELRIAYADWVRTGDAAAPRSIWLENPTRGYRVLIRTQRLEIDVPLPPAAIPDP
jgi:hypothetical protein